MDAIVVGGGIIGLGVALRAAQRGLRTTVVDTGARAGRATHAAAGMLAAVAEAQFGEGALLQLGRESARRWPAFAAELGVAAGRDPGHRESGTLVVARDPDEAEALERELAFRLELGLPVARLRPSAARRLEPALAPTVRLALDVPDDHSVDPRRCLAALREACARAGVRHRDREAVALLDDGERVAGVALADGQELPAARTVLAAGAWSPALAPVPVRPVKGQVLRLRDPAGPGLLGRVLRTEGAYLVPRGDGGYVLGATSEERGFDLAVTAGGVHDLLREAAELVPGVLDLELEEATVGLRPGTPDNAPIIGPGEREGLLWATGHHRNGVLLAPVTADLVAAALVGEAPGALAEAVSPRRFAREAVPA